MSMRIGPMADQMASSRHFVILSSEEPEQVGEMVPIGGRDDLIEKLARANTAAEDDEIPDVLYGPGIRIEMTPGQDPITQMLVTITEDEIGWQVLRRLLNHFQWRLLDPMTGQEMGPAPSPADL